MALWVVIANNYRAIGDEKQFLQHFRVKPILCPSMRSEIDEQDEGRVQASQDQIRAKHDDDGPTQRHIAAEIVDTEPRAQKRQPHRQHSHTSDVFELVSTLAARFRRATVNEPNKHQEKTDKGDIRFENRVDEIVQILLLSETSK